MTPGTIADWMVFTLLLGGIAAVSWLLYAWVMRAEAEPELQRVDVPQDDLTTAA